MSEVPPPYTPGTQEANTTLTSIAGQDPAAWQRYLTLELQVKTLRREVQELKAEIRDIRQEAADLRAKIAVAETEVEALKTTACKVNDVPTLVYDGKMKKSDFIMWYTKLQLILPAISDLTIPEQLSFIRSLVTNACTCHFCTSSSYDRTRCEVGRDYRATIESLDPKAIHPRMPPAQVVLSRIRNIGVRAYKIAFRQT